MQTQDAHRTKIQDRIMHRRIAFNPSRIDIMAGRSKRTNAGNKMGEIIQNLNQAEDVESEEEEDSGVP